MHASNIKYFTVPGTQFVPVKALILSDSIGQNIGAKVVKTDVEAYGGCTIKKLRQKLENQEIPISEFECIALIIGTCDISGKELWKQYKRTGILPPHVPKPIGEIAIEYRLLINTVRKLNYKATVVLCSIIPRPYDHKENRQYLKDLNKNIELIAKSNTNCQYLNISKKFLKCGEIINELFDKDAIHPSPAGNRILTDTLNTVIGQILKK